MVLSIGMIVKNEEKYLERCLTALQPILNELDSELIIADTGSTDNTVEIAKKFTDNVFHFEWINDFAAARNSTLEKAQGEWYMFVDADEIAMDCSGIIRFFKSGEYKNFKSAAYVQRSYTIENDFEEYADFRVMRVVKREKNTKFVNPIHEYIRPFYQPLKYLDFVVLHYGYIYVDENGVNDLAREKSKRNLELLLNELNSSRTVPEERCNIYNQIADGYELVNDLDNALKYIDMGLKKINHHNINITPYYSHKISVLSKQQNFEKIIATANEYFNKAVNPSHTQDLASDCYIRSMQGYAYYKQHEYNKAIPAYTKFIDLYRRYCQGKLNTPDTMMGVWRTTQMIVKASYDIFFRCCYQEKQFALANSYTKAIPIEKYYDDHDFMSNHLNIRIEIMEDVGYNALDELYRQLDEFGKNYLLNIIRRKIFVTKPENRAMIIKKLAVLGETPAQLAEIYKEHFEKSAPDFDRISAFLNKHGSENGEDMLYILLDNQMDISPFLMADDFFADRAVQILIMVFPNGIDLYENYDIDKISPDGLVRAASLYGWVMRRAMENHCKISGFFEMYGALGLKWNSIFGGNAGMPGDILAASLVYNVIAAKNSGDQNGFANAVQKLKNTVPDLIPLVDAYEQENKDVFKPMSVNPEFEQLAVQVKQNIRDLIAARNIGEARKLIKEFGEICPNDPEIEVLKDELNNILQ